MSIHSFSFTPDADGTVEVTATYEAKYTSGPTTDWGFGANSAGSCAAITQSGSTTTGPTKAMTTTFSSQTAIAVADVVAGSSVTVALSSVLTGLVSARYQNIHLVAVLRKR